ncbi:MAG TPA: hypothetical protein PKY84_03960, partial [Thermosynergistes sp.]|nr:hypothetical protein [Thermosynergistes sp.]
MKIDPKRIKRVLVIGLSCLGDMLLASAALWNLRLYLKEAHFTLWVGPRALGAVEGDPLWDEVVPYDRQGEYAGLRGRAKAIRRMREGRYDLIVDLRSTLMPLLSGARFAPLWGFKGVFAPQGVHEAERNIAAVASLGVPIAVRRLRFYVPQSSRDAADRLIGPALKGRPLVVLNPSGSIPEKRWPVERFSGLGLLEEMFHTIASPPMAYLFFVIGTVLLIFEFFTAGVGIAGFVGAVLTIFGCYGFSALPTRPGAIALLVLAMIAFAIDVQVGIPRLWT